MCRKCVDFSAIPDSKLIIKFVAIKKCSKPKPRLLNLNLNFA